MERIFNTYNSSEAALNLSEAKSEIQDNFYDFLDNVPIIRYMTSPNRPRAKDLPKDEEGKIIVDITKPHILEDMDYFRPSALHYMKYGTYTNLRPNPNPNSEFGKWLIEETRRCYEGYVRPSDGEWITGDYYFFLNYCPMLVSKKVKGTNKAVRTESFPDIWDGHYLMSHYLEQARNYGLQAATLSSRGRGKSYWGAGMLAKRFILGVGKGEESRRRTCFILAADTSKLVAGDQTLDKFQYDIDFIRENMQWPSMRLTDALQKMQWKMGYIDLNTGTKKGTLNSVVGFSIVDEAKIRGSRGDLFLFEEAGSFPKLLDTYNNLIPSVKFGDEVYGQIFLYGTSGDSDSDFQSMQEIMYNPDGYGVYGVNNVYDKEGFGKKLFTFFFPEYLNRAGCYDSNGNSNVTKALFEIITERIKVKYNSSDIRTILKTISDRPIVPQEAIMRVRGNFFPITDINNRIAQLDSNPSEYDDVYVGKIIFNSENRPEFQPTSDTPIRDFPLKNDSTKGAVEIYKLPEKDSNGNIFSNRYIAGLDPIDDDASDDSSHSLMSFFVLDLWTDSIACEYTERTSFADDGYEMIRRILLFYNARCLYEAHPYSQKVYTPNGQKLWKDIKIGDKLFSPTKGIVTVTDIPVNEKMPIYKITLSDGRIVEASDNHIWLVYKGTSKNLVEMTTLQMFNEGVKTKWNQSKFFIPEHNGVEYAHKNLPIDSYTMGLILSEGSIINNHCFKNGIQISSSYEDMEFYKKVIPYNIKHIGNKGFSWHIHITNCKSIMLNYNLYNKDSHNKFIPKDYLQSSKEQRFELLKGLMDGDGCAKTNGASIFITCSEELANNVLELTRSLGIKSWLQTSRSGVYRVAISSIYKLFKLPRKVKEQHIYYPYSKGSKASAILNKTAIVDIKYSHEEMGKCVTVDSEDGLYLIGDYIITHNCNKKGIFSYFSKMNCLYLLEDTPEYLKDRDLVKVTGFGNKAKGYTATKNVNDYSNQLIRDWLMQPVTIHQTIDGKETETTVYKLYTVRNRAFLRECSLFNPDINVDRIRAFGAVMLSREQHLIYNNGTLKSDSEKIERDYLGNDDFFTRNYDRRKQ